MSKEKLKIFMNVFFTAQFGYYPLFCMFDYRTLNNTINKLPEKRVLPQFIITFPLLLVNSSKKTTILLFTIEISRKLDLKFVK